MTIFQKIHFFFPTSSPAYKSHSTNEQDTITWLMKILSLPDLTYPVNKSHQVPEGSDVHSTLRDSLQLIKCHIISFAVNGNITVVNVLKLCLHFIFLYKLDNSLSTVAILSLIHI